MSLDVYLSLKTSAIAQNPPRIFIREDGQTKEITREEWDRRYPDREPIMVESPVESNTRVYAANITHNLAGMADEAGLYEVLWRPEELEIAFAKELIDPLRSGLFILKNDPEKFRAFNPSNGWGDYDALVQFVENYLVACESFPDAEVYASR